MARLGVGALSKLGTAPAPAVAPAAGPPGGRGNDVYQLIGRFQLIGQAVDAIKGAIPSFSHSIQCSVVGGPHADIRRIWYLAVSVVYGRFRNRVRFSASPVRMDAVWDISGKAVSLELNYTANTLVGLTGRLDDPGASAAGFLARGPEQVTIGGGWNTIFNPFVGRAGPVFVGAEPTSPVVRPTWFSFLTPSGCIGTAGSGGALIPYTIRIDGFDGQRATPASKPARALREFPTTVSTDRTLTGVTTAVLPGDYPYNITYITNGAGGGARGQTSAVPERNALPRLPDDGRIITTPEKYDTRLQPPKPTLDGHTRGSYLSLVAAALQDPCYLPEAPPCTRNNAGQGGVFVTNAGDPTSAAPLDLATLWRKRSGHDFPWPLNAAQGPDGYRLQTPGPVPNYGG